MVKFNENSFFYDKLIFLKSDQQDLDDYDKVIKCFDRSFITLQKSNLQASITSQLKFIKNGVINPKILILKSFGILTRFQRRRTLINLKKFVIKKYQLRIPC